MLALSNPQTGAREFESVASRPAGGQQGDGEAKGEQEEMTDKFAQTTFHGWLNGVLRLLAVLGLLPLRAAHAAAGTWT